MFANKSSQLSGLLRREVHSRYGRWFWRSSTEICREAIVNAVSHAEASRIDVGIIYGRRFLEVGCHDDGRGIPRDIGKSASREGRWGLPGMNARAGPSVPNWRIWSTEGKGTDIEIRVPAAAAYVARNNTRVHKAIRYTLGKMGIGSALRA